MWYVAQNDLVCFYVCVREKWREREMERKCVRVVRDYCKFLGAMRHCDQVVEPTPLVDLVWHTHQQMPFRYRKDCLRLAGRLIDHHDSPCDLEAVRKMHEGG